MKSTVVTSTCSVFALSVGCLLAGCQNNEQKAAPSNEKKTVAAANEQKTVPTAVSSTEQKMTNVITYASGLKREIIKAALADAKSPKSGQQVMVHYTGWLDENGKLGRKFDSSVDRGTPFTFIVGVHQVIQGWDEGVMEMKVGEKCRLTIPASIGYGSRGAGGVIPPNATLIFDVELLKIA